MGSSERSVSGNVALLNQFQIVFFDDGMFYTSTDNQEIAEDFGGRAMSVLGSPKSLNDVDSISASIIAATKNTIRSLKEAETSRMPDTERIESAELVSLDVIKGVITAVIDVKPVALELSELPRFQVPIISR